MEHLVTIMMDIGSKVAAMKAYQVGGGAACTTENWAKINLNSKNLLL